jgi:hypothetical protein
VDESGWMLGAGGGGGGLSCIAELAVMKELEQ